MEVDNIQGRIMDNGVKVRLPLVAVAYSWSMLTFESDERHAGEVHHVSCNGKSVQVTLDGNGHGEVSLLPFIRDAVQASGAQDAPLAFDMETLRSTNPMRGQMAIAISQPNSTDTEQIYNVYFVFGDYGVTRPTDIYIDYMDDLATFVGIDNAVDSNATTMLPLDARSFTNNWYNLNKLDIQPMGDVILSYTAMWFGAKIVRASMRYHLRYDCRRHNVYKVRWLDQYGNVTVRQFTVGGESRSGAIQDAYQRPHGTAKTVNGDYWHGKDEWAEVAPARTMTFGDDAIPIAFYEWVSGLASSPCVDVYMDGLWQRCNIGGFSIDRDPRKATFDVSFTLAMPTHDVQQF